MVEVSIIAFILILATLSVSSFLIKSSNSIHILACQITIVTIFLLARDPTAAVDYFNYRNFYNSTTSFDSIFNAYANDYMFAFLSWIGNILSLDAETYFRIYPIICLILSIFGLFFLVRKRYLPIAFGFFIINPGFILLFTNALRQGLSVPLLIIGIAFYFRNSRLLSYLFLIASIFAHSATLPLIIIFLVLMQLTKKLNKAQLIKTTILIMILTIVISLVAFLFPNILLTISKIGGPFSKIARYQEYSYSSTVFYIKLIVSYLLSVINIYFLVRYPISDMIPYKLLLFIQSCIFISFIFLPIPLISSRFLYYPELIVSSIIPYTYSSFLRQSNLKYINCYILWMITAMIGSFVYLFPSIRVTTGL